jgi:hypothetical protein
LSDNPQRAAHRKIVVSKYSTACDIKLFNFRQ